MQLDNTEESLIVCKLIITTTNKYYLSQTRHVLHLNRFKEIVLLIGSDL